MKKLRQRLNDLPKIPSKLVARRGIQLRVPTHIIPSN